MDPTLNWRFAEIISLENNQIEFQIFNKEKKIEKGILTFKNLKWSVPKSKTIKDIHKIGDIIFVKKEKNFLEIKTISQGEWWNCCFRPFYR